eukprot:9380855-Pyramimonas_sp.AAC.1
MQIPRVNPRCVGEQKVHARSFGSPPEVIPKRYPTFENPIRHSSPCNQPIRSARMVHRSRPLQLARSIESGSELASGEESAEAVPDLPAAERIPQSEVKEVARALRKLRYDDLEED